MCTVNLADVNSFRAVSSSVLMAGFCEVYYKGSTISPGRNVMAAEPTKVPSTWTPAGAIEAANQIDDWIAIEPDGSIRVNSGKVELGTGVRTALAQIAAEELDVPLDRIHMEMGRTGITPDEGYTAGSKTIYFGGHSIRQASAEARQALIEAAAAKLGVPVEELTVRDGVVLVAGDESHGVSYAEIMGGKRFNRRITGSAATKSPADYRIVGKTARRVDLPGKFTGAGSYVHDMRLPGMIHARVVRPPSAGAELLSVDGPSTAGVQVVRLGNFLAVAADREETAVRAARELKVEWRERQELPSDEEFFDYLRDQPTTDREAVSEGDAAAAMKRARERREAAYFQPHQSHASVGPSCAVAEMHDGMMTVWCPTQGVYPLRAALADLLEMPEERVRVMHAEGAGCYGQNGADDVAADAVLIARETGKPVRLLWSRSDEFGWEPYGPAMIMSLRGGVDADGRVSGWQNEVWSPSHSGRGRTALDLVAGQLVAGERPPIRKFFIGGDRNAPTNYDIADQRIVMHWLDREPLRTSSLRSLGAFANCFANESFMDELAEAAGRDPVQFRLDHLSDPRATAVVEAAARASDWGSSLPDDEGRGVAFARYENEEAYVAMVVQAAVDRASGQIRVKRVTVAHDCGLIINPDGIKNQIEGNIIQSMSRALKERVRWKDRRVTSLDWKGYPIVTFSEVPEIDVVLIDRPAEQPVGAGEPATVTTAPAIANAVHAACGIRLRHIPFLPEAVKAALAE